MKLCFCITFGLTKANRLSFTTAKGLFFFSSTHGVTAYKYCAKCEVLEIVAVRMLMNFHNMLIRSGK